MNPLKGTLESAEAALLLTNLGVARGEASKDRIEIMKFLPPIFRRLVLVCIDSYDSESRRIFQHFSRSTRFTILCTAQISKFQQKIVQIFGGMKK